MESINNNIKRKTRNQKRRDNKVALCFAVVVIIFAIIGIFVSYKSHSTYNNKENTKNPGFKANWLTGEAQEQYADYVDDKFILGDALNIANTKLASLLGQHERNGVLIGKDDYLIDIFDEPDSNILKKQVKALNSFANSKKADLGISMVIAPTKSNILEEKLPMLGYGGNQPKYIDKFYGNLKNISVIDLQDTLKEHIDEDIYYKTDSSWTSLGAYYAYNNIAEELRWDTSDDKYESLAVSTDFRGDLSYKSGFNTTIDENIFVYFNSHTEFGTVVTKPNGKKTGSMFDRKALETNDKLNVFFGKDINELKIDSTCLNEGNLLVVGDKYLRSIVPFFTGQFQTVYTIDADTYDGDVNRFISTHNISDVMFLFSANSLEHCENLVRIIE